MLTYLQNNINKKVVPLKCWNASLTLRAIHICFVVLGAEIHTKKQNGKNLKMFLHFPL